MVLDKLGESLRNALGRLVRAGYADKKEVEELTSEIKKALIKADVDIQLAASIADRIKKRSLAEKPAKTLTAKEHLINIVYEELVKFLGREKEEINIEKKPTYIMLVGLFGSGKTTSVAKVAKFYKEKGLKVAVLQTDTWRPAAYEQLEQLAEKIKVPFFGDKKGKDPVKIFKENKDKLNKFDIVIVDSAGRDALNKELVEEIDKLNKTIKPQEKLLVISGDIGQAAQAQAQKFHDTVGVTGVIISKLDGTAKGGGALTACSATQAKVKFIGVGEKVDDLEQFKPKNFVSRLLGMGDLETLLERAEKAMSKEEAERLAKRVVKGDFTLEDLYEQMKAMKKMGSLGSIASMIPGLGNMLPKELLKTQEGKLDSWKVIIDSTTIQERSEPDLINASRIRRIAHGAGKSEAEVRELIKQFRQMKKLLKDFSNPRQMKKLAKMMGKGGMKGLDPNMLKGMKF